MDKLDKLFEILDNIEKRLRRLEVIEKNREKDLIDMARMTLDKHKSAIEGIEG